MCRYIHTYLYIYIYAAPLRGQQLTVLPMQKLQKWLHQQNLRSHPDFSPGNVIPRNRYRPSSELVLQNVCLN